MLQLSKDSIRAKTKVSKVPHQTTEFVFSTSKVGKYFCPLAGVCQCFVMKVGIRISVRKLSKKRQHHMSHYCKWCYADGTYTYSDMDELIEVCVKNMVSESFTEAQARSYMNSLLPTLDYWKHYDQLSDNGQFEEFKKQLIREINELHIEGMPRLKRLNALVGSFVNLEYRLPNGITVKLLNDSKTYLGNQLQSEFGGERCFGVVADMDFILVSTYEKNGVNPELVVYKKR